MTCYEITEHSKYLTLSSKILTCILLRPEVFSISAYQFI